MGGLHSNFTSPAADFLEADGLVQSVHECDAWSALECSLLGTDYALQDIGCAFDRIADLLTPDLAAGNIYSPFEGVRRALWQIEAV